MKKHFTLLLLIAISLLINSCKKHETITTPDPVVPYDAGTAITTAIAGKVTAQDGTALNGVEITIGTSTTITDVGGNFIIPQASINQKVGLVKATKTGYFVGSRTIIAQEKVINNVVIQLVKKTETGSFINATGGTVTTATGASIVFGVNAVATKTGAAYTGTVKVSAYFLDPTSNNCFKEMPGDLRGINTSNNEQVLTSYGMMAVELQGSNGEALQIATGKTATLTFPIVTSIQANAPATIPLWFFDETKGMWIEQGTATKTGNNYVGTVSHFTWWNCDLLGPFIKYKIKFVGFHFFPIANALVTIARKVNGSNFSSIANGITSSDGSISKLVPYNEALEIKVYESPLCLGNMPIYTASISPLTQDTDGGTVTLSSNINTKVAFITGTVVNCNNKPVMNGYVIAKVNNQSFYGLIDSGNVIISIPSCNLTSNIASLDVFDTDSLKRSIIPIQVTLTMGSSTSFLGAKACGLDINEYFVYTIDGTTYYGNNLNAYTAVDASDIYQRSKFNFEALTQNPAENMSGFTYNSINGIFAATINYRHLGINYGTGNGTIEITHYDTVGKYIQAIFNTGSIAAHKIQGSFRIKRTQ